MTGTCDFGDDLALKMPPGTLELAVVQPGINHGRIKSIDVTEAEAMPGVVKVLTAKDVKGTNRIMIPVGHPRSKADGFERPIICDEKVFRYGDIVAIVAANTREQARAAAKKVKVDIEPLPYYMSYLEAVAPGAMEIHPGTPNEYLRLPLLKGEDTRDVIDESDYVVEGLSLIHISWISAIIRKRAFVTISGSTGRMWSSASGTTRPIYRIPETVS